MPRTPEDQARESIDAQLGGAGWSVQDLADLNLSASRGVAVRELRSQGGPADYILFVDGKALGVVEAKRSGSTLSHVAEQSGRYSHAKKWIPQRWATPLPFTYETTGIETNFRDQRDPDARSREVFAFHTPAHLLELVQQPDTLRARLKTIPPLITTGLRDCQIDAITKLEASLADNRPRALIQMATGAGKTFTAVTATYRLIVHAGAKRILFLVDRGNLGRQTIEEFQKFKTPGDGRLFTELYNVQMLGPAGIDPVCSVTVATIQRLYSQLSGKEIDDEIDEHSGFNYAKRDRLTRKKRWAIQDEEEAVAKTQLDRSVVVPDQIRTIIRTFKEKLFVDLFLRDIRSQLYFEQMKGRGTRTINPTDLATVTPDAGTKTRFVLVDAVGVTESDKTDSRPLERKLTVAFDQLLKNVAIGHRDEDTLVSLANRIARLDQSLSDSDKAELQSTGGLSLKQLASDLLRATDPDQIQSRAAASLGEEEETQTS